MEPTTTSLAPAPGLNVEFLFIKLYGFLTGAGSIEPQSLLTATFAFVEGVWHVLRIGSALLAPLVVVGIVYVFIRIGQLKEEQEEAFKQNALFYAREAGGARSERWRRLEDMANSESPSEWRHAIIEADVMLDQLLSEQNVPGITLGDKLKSAHFSTLNEAWEAHKTRNQIAHAGSDFILTQRETRRVLDLYRRVFSEFNYI